MNKKKYSLYCVLALASFLTICASNYSVYADTEGNSESVSLVSKSDLDAVSSIEEVENTPSDDAKTNLAYEGENIALKQTAKDVTSEVLPQLEGDSHTILMEFESDFKNDLQALVGISNPTAGKQNNYFSIFSRSNGEVGVEVRDAESKINYLYSRPAALVGKDESNQTAVNKLAFISDKETGSYSMYLNGHEIFSEHPTIFKAINDISGLASVNLGGVNRQGKIAFAFSGVIKSVQLYNGTITKEEAEEVTSSKVSKLIYSSNDEINSNYYRIPTLYTLSNGRVLSTIDARYGGTHDSKSKINIASSYSDDHGETWSKPSLPLSFDDYENQKIDWPRAVGLRDQQISGSASFIDSALVEDKSIGNVFLLTDVMPAGIGNNNSNKTDSGFKEIDGKYYLKLKKSGDRDYDYSVREAGRIFNDKTGQATEYRLGANYQLFQNDKLLTQEQYSVRFVNGRLEEYKNGKQVAMNVFYKDALFKVLPTNYVGYTVSKDHGESWSDFKLLPPFLGSKHNGTYLSPGQGIYLESKGRIMFSSYANGKMVYIHSDDHGLTWAASTAALPFANATAEAQMVELKPGVVRTYLRTSTGKIAYMTSRDGGDSWDQIRYLDIIKNTRYGTQVSVIRYSHLIDGKNAIILSSPHSESGRRNGQIWIGLIDPQTEEVDFKYHYDVDLAKFGYSYSALTELADGRIGLLYEKFDSWSRNELHLKDVIPFLTFDIETLLGKKR